MLGLTAELFEEYVDYIADRSRRLERIGLPKQYNASNPFPWMSETIEPGNDKIIFDSRVTNYHFSASLRWDE